MRDANVCPKLKFKATSPTDRPEGHPPQLMGQKMKANELLKEVLSQKDLPEIKRINAENLLKKSLNAQ